MFIRQTFAERACPDGQQGQSHTGGPNPVPAVQGESLGRGWGLAGLLNWFGMTRAQGEDFSGAVSVSSLREEHREAIDPGLRSGVKSAPSAPRTRRRPR
jgi:hypothetical protein